MRFLLVFLIVTTLVALSYSSPVPETAVGPAAPAGAVVPVLAAEPQIKRRKLKAGKGKRRLKAGKGKRKVKRVRKQK